MLELYSVECDEVLALSFSLQLRDGLEVRAHKFVTHVVVNSFLD